MPRREIRNLGGQQPDAVDQRQPQRVQQHLARRHARRVGPDLPQRQVIGVHAAEHRLRGRPDVEPFQRTRHAPPAPRDRHAPPCARRDRARCRDPASRSPRAARRCRNAPAHATPGPSRDGTAGCSRRRSTNSSGCRAAAAPMPCSVFAHQPSCCRIALFGIARSSRGWRMRAAPTMPSACRAAGRDPVTSSSDGPNAPSSAA